MLRTQISLAGIIFVAVFFETVLVPGVWSRLRIDLFIGMIIGVMIHLSFSQGLTFVLITSLLLQAFSGARPGLVPMIYLGIFFVACLLKGIIYMENILTQLILAGVFSILVASALVISLDLNPSQAELFSMAAGGVLTGLLSPLMVALVGSLKKAYEA
jgi:hypothetical protein